MSILGRLTKRNILGKPMRSFAIIIALAASAFALLLCIGGRDAPEQQLRKSILNTYGGAEIQFIDIQNRSLDIKESDLPENSKLIVFTTWSGNAVSAKGEYAVKMTYFDQDRSLKFGFTESKLDPGDGVIISEAFAKKAELKEGDTLKLTREVTPGEGSEDAEPVVKEVTLKVKEISKDKYLRRNSTTLFMSEANVQKLGDDGKTGRVSAYLDIPNDLDVRQTAMSIQEKYPNYVVGELLTDSVLESLDNQTMVFVLIFAVILMMTLFLTFSMSKHIANERISTIGTLRSLGGSIPKTSAVLLTESGIYGLIGGIIGAVLFAVGGRFAIQTLFGTIPEEWSIALYMYPLSVIFAVAIQIICQVGALVRAVKTPVRDIIFSSRDTAYHMSFKKLIIGAVLLTGGIILGMFADTVVLSVTAITLICVGGVSVLPLLLKGISKVLVKLFAALGMPCAKLAANECSHKKSSVASTQLTFVSLAITIAVFVTSMSISQLYNPDIYHMDAVIDMTVSPEKAEKLVKNEGVTDYQFLIQDWSNVTVNGGKKVMANFVVYDDFRLYTGVQGLGTEPAKDEVYMGEGFAKRYGIKAGDTVEIVNKNIFIIKDDGSEEYTTYKMKVKGLCSTLYHYANAFVVNKDWFKDELGTLIDRIYFKVSDPKYIEELSAEAEKMYRDASVETREEIVAELEEDNASIMTVLYSMIVIGCVLAVLGAVSNAIIGFEQSRRKYAVLHSVAASKKKLSKLILLEVLISSLVAGTLALIVGLLLSSLLETTLNGLDLGVEIIFNIPLILVFIIILTAALLLASVKPISSLKKMNTAAELKYE